MMDRRVRGRGGVPLAESAVKVVSETSVGAIVTTITLSALTVGLGVRVRVRVGIKVRVRREPG